MKLKYKLPLLLNGALLVVTVSLTIFYFLYHLNKINKRKETVFKQTYEEQKKQLKEKVDIAIHTEKQFLKETPNINQENFIFLQDQIFQNISMLAISYPDEHIWINELNSPYRIILDSKSPRLVGRSALIVLPKTKENLFKLFQQKVKKFGETDLSYELYNKKDENNITKLSYIKLLAEKDWVVGIEMNKDRIWNKVETSYLHQKNVLIKETFLFLFFGLIISLLISFVFYVLVSDNTLSLLRISDNLINFSQGKEVKEIPESKRKDEIEMMIKASNFLIINFKRYIQFAKQIELGNLDESNVIFEKNDTLGQTLNNLRLNLVAAKKLEKERQIELKIRNWSNEGFSHFNDILRQDHEDISALAYDVISYMVQYIKAHQGAIFIYVEKKKMLELTAAYAAERKKYLQKSVKIKEGLVGACAAEMDILHYKKIPEDYLSITSGLGNAQPKELLFIPLILDKVLFGVIELASLHEFKQEEIDFVQRVSTSIASTLNSVRINQQTKLYLERARQEETLRNNQEHELRLRVEELETLKREREREEKVKTRKEQSEPQEPDENGYELF